MYFIIADLCIYALCSDKNLIHFYIFLNLIFIFLYNLDFFGTYDSYINKWNSK